MKIFQRGFKICHKQKLLEHEPIYAIVYLLLKGLNEFENYHKMIEICYNLFIGLKF